MPEAVTRAPQSKHLPSSSESGRPMSHDAPGLHSAPSRPISAHGDEDIDLWQALMTLARGWKILLAAAVLSAIVGSAALLRQPVRYRADVVVTARAHVPRPDSFPESAHGGDAFNSDVAGAQPPPGTWFDLWTQPRAIVLEEYARVALAPGVLDKLATAAVQEASDERLHSADGLRSILSVSPVEDRPQLRFSAVTAVPEEAKVLVVRAAQYGIEAVEAVRRQRDEGTRQKMAVRKDALLRAYRQQEKAYLETRARERLAETTTELEAARDRVEALQRTIASIEAEAMLRDARACFTEGDGKPIPDASEEGLASDPGRSSALEAVRDRASKTLLTALKKTESLQSEAEEALVEVMLARRRLDSSRDAYVDAEQALLQWDAETERQRAFFAVDSNTPISVKTVGQPFLVRIILVEIAALGVASMVVFGTDAMRRRRAPRFRPMERLDHERSGAGSVPASSETRRSA